MEGKMSRARSGWNDCIGDCTWTIVCGEAGVGGVEFIKKHFVQAEIARENEAVVG